MPTDLYLVDTSAWLFALRKDFFPAVKDRIDGLLREDVLLTTGIVKLELLGGTKTEKEFRRLKSRLDAFPIIATGEEVWQHAYDLAFQLRRKGVTVPYTDILIATCALQANCVLIHADSHFDLMAKHVHLETESFVQLVSAAINP
jgi:predicted nucleic acid-binding protein